jgi:hypothetical protein
MLAHYHGQIWNSSEFARSFGVADTTIRNYLDVLASALVITELQPWHENISKRQIKSLKIYLSDSWILHTLLNISPMQDLEKHPKLGASWEGFVISQLIRQLGVRVEEFYFWGTHAGSESDLFVVRGRIRLGFEVKRTTSPRLTPSMRNALKDLKLASLDVIHAGERTFGLAERTRAVAFARLLDDIKPIRLSAHRMGALFLFSQEPTGKNQLIPMKNIKVEKDVVYAEVDGLQLKLDIACPDNLLEPAPAIVDIPGGAWRSVRKSVEDAILYAKHGFIGVSITHRTSDIAIFPAAVHDCKTVIR